MEIRIASGKSISKLESQVIKLSIDLGLEIRIYVDNSGEKPVGIIYINEHTHYADEVDNA